MEPITLPDITITQGAAFNDVLELYEDDAGTIPANIAGIDFVSEIRDEPRKTGTLLGLFVLTPGVNTLQRHIHAAVTALIPLPGGWYDIKATPVAGEPEVWFTGKIIVKEGRTA